MHICRLCSCGEVEDQVHFLTICPALLQYRTRLFNQCATLDSSFITSHHLLRPNSSYVSTMILLLNWSSNVSSPAEYSIPQLANPQMYIYLPPQLPHCPMIFVPSLWPVSQLQARQPLHVTSCCHINNNNIYGYLPDQTLQWFCTASSDTRCKSTEAFQWWLVSWAETITGLPHILLVYSPLQTHDDTLNLNWCAVHCDLRLFAPQLQLASAGSAPWSSYSYIR